MRFALVNGRRQEAQPSLTGECPGCGTPMVAKCGENRVWHWAHQSRRECDPWWENKTRWHRNWQEQFPDDWQEVVLQADDGERHFADVKTGDDWVLEFQYSHIKPEERRSRENFYAKLLWVVNGQRLETGYPGFERALNEGKRLNNSPAAWQVWSQEGVLLKRWCKSHVHVYFDFGPEKPLWWLSPESDDVWSYVLPVSRASFIALHNRTVTEGFQDFDSFAGALSGFVSRYKKCQETHRSRVYSEMNAPTIPKVRRSRRL